MAHKEFIVGEHMFLKVKGKSSSLKLESFPNLVARYCGLFEILEMIGPLTYIFALPTSMKVHIVFHVSLLKKYVLNLNHVNVWTII
jgi:hypothetical protein